MREQELIPRKYAFEEIFLNDTDGNVQPNPAVNPVHLPHTCERQCRKSQVICIRKGIWTNDAKEHWRSMRLKKKNILVLNRTACDFCDSESRKVESAFISFGIRWFFVAVSKSLKQKPIRNSRSALGSTGQWCDVLRRLLLGNSCSETVKSLSPQAFAQGGWSSARCPPPPWKGRIWLRTWLNKVQMKKKTSFTTCVLLKDQRTQKPWMLKSHKIATSVSRNNECILLIKFFQHRPKNIFLGGILKWLTQSTWTGPRNPLFIRRSGLGASQACNAVSEEDNPPPLSPQTSSGVITSMLLRESYGSHTCSQGVPYGGTLSNN